MKGNKEPLQIRPFQFYEEIESRSKSTSDNDGNLDAVVVIISLN
jgi:hypothetical protein